MFQVFLTGNNSDYFTISPTAVQGRADIRMRVAIPLDYEEIRSYSFSVSLKLIIFNSSLLQCSSEYLHRKVIAGMNYLTHNLICRV